MLDIKFIRENPDLVKKAAENKKANVSSQDVDHLLKLDEKRRDFIKKIEQLNSDKKEAAQKQDHKQGKKIKQEVQKAEAEFQKIKVEFDELLNKLPNVPSEDTPIGKDEGDNKVLRQVGEVPKFDFQPREHWKLGADLDVIDIPRATKVSGARFAFLKGDLALMEFALIQLVFDTLTNETTLQEIIDQNKLETVAKPFTPVLPPMIIKHEPMKRMARHHPEEMFHLERDEACLIGSAEHTLGAMHMDEVLEEKDLPLRYIGFSTAYRREAGSYGKDTKGILRMHQFDKLEMESFSTPDKSLVEQDLFVAIQEFLVQKLEIPYQVVQICTGDMGGPDIRQVDIECWMPGQNKYRETHTADLMGDYQARRLQTRIKMSDGQTELAHMNDATAFAIGRILIAIMENYQQKDGSILIPQALQSYMNGLQKISSNNK